MTGQKGRRAPHEDLTWRSYGLALGERVKTVRALRELTQEQLAAESGVSRNQISAIENSANHRAAPGNPRLDTIYRLALALRVPPAALLPASDTLVAREVRVGNALDLSWLAPYAEFIERDGIVS